MALMAGLTGRACEFGTNRITAASLRNYLNNNMKEFFDKADQENGRTHEAQLEPPLKNSDKDFVIVQVAKAETKGSFVRILLPANLKGSTIQIRNNAFEVVASQKPAPVEWKRELPRGLYLAEVTGGPASRAFEIKASGAGKEVVDVDFR